MASRKTYVYAGIAGETAPGRQVNSGLFRMQEGNGGWESLTNGLPENPSIRAISIHPNSPEIVYAGTQQGPYRSNDHGDHWERVNVPDHNLTTWSILFHPRDPNVMYAGYENTEIYRSDDAGEHWQQLPVSVRFPEVTMRPGANPAKRVLNMSASMSDPNELYGAVEVGGLIRTLDGGDHWENLSHGQYLNDDLVDTHSVLSSRLRPGTVFSISRAALFRSSDRGDHWTHMPLDPLNEKGQTYSRQIREVPGDPKSIWISSGGDFDSIVGALFHSEDGGMSWTRVNIGFHLDSTLFGLAIDQQNPTTMYCASSNGQVFGSHDGGEFWTDHHLPEGATQLYALACG
jgi:photosystem II stability/assembly factor-like uncharacterized protein